MSWLEKAVQEVPHSTWIWDFKPLQKFNLGEALMTAEPQELTKGCNRQIAKIVSISMGHIS